MQMHSELDQKAIERAAEHLARGGIVAFPTETVYGLGADTFNPTAVEAVYRMKGRPRDNPSIAHVSGPEMAATLVQSWPAEAQQLAETFWPGPLALVLPRHPRVPAVACGGRDTVAVRSPDHPCARALLAACSCPISAPSANRSGHVSATTAEHVRDDFGDIRDLLILDGGPCAIGVESTVLALGSEPRILRPGQVSTEMLTSCIGKVIDTPLAVQGDSPGTSSRHYAPVRPLHLVRSSELVACLQDMESCAVLCCSATRIPGSCRAFPMPGDPDAYARCLYETLRRADACENMTRIVVECPPDSPGWGTIIDRLQRASGSPGVPA